MQNTALMCRVQHHQRFQCHSIPHVNARLGRDFTGCDDPPYRMPLNARNLQTVPLVESLHIFVRTVKNTEPRGEVDQIFVAVFVALVVLDNLVPQVGALICLWGLFIMKMHVNDCKTAV